MYWLAVCINGRSDGRTDRRTDGRTDGQTDRQTDRQTDGVTVNLTRQISWANKIFWPQGQWWQYFPTKCTTYMNDQWADLMRRPNVPVYETTANTGSRGIAPIILKVGPWRRWVISPTLRPPYLWVKSLTYPMHKRLGGTRKRSKRYVAKEKPLTPVGPRNAARPGHSLVTIMTELSRFLII
jgi:hypothetical protein